MTDKPTPALLRTRAEALLEHFPGEHAALDAAAIPGLPNRHDTRRALLEQAEAMERHVPAHENPLYYPRPERTPDTTAQALRDRLFGSR